MSFFLTSSFSVNFTLQKYQSRLQRCLSFPHIITSGILKMTRENKVCNKIQIYATDTINSWGFFNTHFGWVILSYNKVI
jgi:acyl-ACP thioesterase